VVLPSGKVTLFEYLILDFTSNVFLVSIGETILCIVLGEDVGLDTDSFVEGIDSQSQWIGNLLPEWWCGIFRGTLSSLLAGEGTPLLCTADTVAAGVMMINKTIE